MLTRIVHGLLFLSYRISKWKFNSQITKRTHSQITRGDVSPKIFNIAYYVSVFQYLTFHVRSYKFETISYAIKLKNFHALPVHES